MKSISCVYFTCLSDDDDDCDRLSPLHVAVLQDNVELTSLLLQHGAQVDCADKKGQTLL